MSGFLFLVITVFWVVKPIKRGMMLDYYGAHPLEWFGTTFMGAEVEQLGKILNVFVAMVAVALFTLAVRRFRRVVLVYICCALFAVGFIVFGLSMDEQSGPLVIAFYSYGDLFNTVMVALFWAFMHDLVVADQAKRLYGIVGLGGVLGGLFGSTVVASGVEDVGRAWLVTMCVVPLFVASLIAWWVDRIAQTKFKREDKPLDAKHSSSLLEGAKLVLSSRYLTAIAATILIYEVTSNIIDFQLSAIVQETITDATERDAFFAFVGQVTGGVSVFVQLVLTSFVMRRFGVGVALLFLPACILAGSVGFLVMSTIAFATMLSASDNALNYSIHQSAKEALYVPTSRDEKYKAKAVIDMFVQRSAKLLAVGLNLVFAAFVGLASVRWLSLGTIALLGAWIPLSIWLGRRFEQRAKERETKQ
jgi:AAA family ATP:ADP antiporter